MRKISLLALIAIMALAACQKGPAGSAADLSTKTGKAGYAIGQEMGKSLLSVKDQIDVSAVVAGLRDSVEGKDSKLSPEDARSAIMELQMAARANHDKKSGAVASKNLQESKLFLAENGAKEGVKTTASGLQYKVVKEGKGKKPSATDRVVVHYEGKLLNGTVFDSSRERGSPVTFPVNQVIPGWTEALQLMPEGSRYILYIPPNLAYGTKGAGQKIGPNSALIFDVELLRIEK